jgi:pimeloyl-ACP methyl ester carboxylesterase
VFIHGIGGYPQEFRHLIAQLDRTKFQAWVVQYPSGWALGDSAEYFRRGLDEMQATHGFERMCLVAHSMGGVVSRAMLNLQAEDGGSSYIRLFVTIASPLGGHPAAAQGARLSPVVVPSWRDLVPDGEFIRRLYEHPLRADTRYVLLATTRDTIVPIESQLRDEAQEEAALIRAFAASHVGVLEDEALARRLNTELLNCRGDTPAAQAQP